MTKKKILCIGGSLNQTSMIHQVSQHLEENYDCYFSPYYGDGIVQKAAEAGWLGFTVLGGNFRVQTDQYLADHNLKVDFKGDKHDYDLVITTSDLLVPKNIRQRKVILVQEGMTDPETIMFYLVKWFKLPRYLASTSTNGLSHAYDYFCVASEGYRDLFIKKGVKPEKIVVTGIPNFDNVARYSVNDYPYHNYVLVATSDARETFKYDNRKKFIRKVIDIAKGRQIIFKLHPNENFKRAKQEIMSLAPKAMIVTEGDIGPMIANCDVLITQYSTVSYVGLGLGKEVHSYFDVDMLKRLLPIQNGGTSSQNIAEVCRRLIEGEPIETGKVFTYAHA